MLHNIIIILVPFVIGIILGVYIVPRLMLVSIKDDWAQMPNELDKKSYTALQIAGVSIFPVLIISLCLSFLMPLCLSNNYYVQTAYHMVPRILQVITGITILFVAGLKYDMNGSSSFMRFLAILIASCLFPASQMCITNFNGIFGIYEIPAWIGSIITVLLSMYLIEMVKLLDGMDGLASGTSVILLSLFIPLFVTTESITPAVVSACALGAVLPFFIMKKSSRKWQKSIMGNSGSYILGYVIAYVVIALFCRAGTVYYNGIQVLAFSIVMMPMLDVLRVVGSRARDGRSLNMPDRNQINYKIIRTGLPNWTFFPIYFALILLYVVTTYVLLRYDTDINVILLIDVLLWIMSELVLNYFIHERNRKTHQSEWNKVYGRDAWNAGVPYERIWAKRKAFGNIGLPSYFVNGTDFEFVPDGMSGVERKIKRLADLIMSGICLILFSPLFLLCYFLIKINDGGPAIYKQERIGRFGRPFYIYKYRSMRLDAEPTGPQLSRSNCKDDPRLTKVGRFLRLHHLDELPQLWNVFRGDMAFVGYRPERKYFIDKIMEHDPRYAFLYQIKPGVTSYATLYNGYTDTMEKMLRRLELDLYYLANRSWWFDCKILFLTFTAIIFGKKF
jgi:lipopolysaccharide/colanic/teichoic acid biosynthesis glycosyltransferase/UDP-N-acetylmuramyl pentapeptide phosphotransferase/UDP-N-acetylglucosamine-1-phosphate transferase